MTAIDDEDRHGADGGRPGRRAGDERQAEADDGVDRGEERR